MGWGHLKIFSIITEPEYVIFTWKLSDIRPFLVFSLFASVQNCETYPPARGKNKQAFKNKVVFACCVDVKQQKFNLLHLSTKEILKKEYKQNNQNDIWEHYKIFAFTIQFQKWKDAFCRCFLLFVLHLSWFKTYPHADAKQRKTKKWPNVHSELFTSWSPGSRQGPQ
jgi:hypothetical protein